MHPPLDSQQAGNYGGRLLSVDSEDLRLAMRQWATGVTVVSALHDGRRHGMTVSSFTSISLTPPLVMVSLEQGTTTYGLVWHARHYAVTILDQEQQNISDRFAGRVSESSDRFAGLDTFTLVSGAPLLADGLAWFDCRVVATYRAGNHTVFIGSVLAVKIGAEGLPLIYYDRNYQQLKVG